MPNEEETSLENETVNESVDDDSVLDDSPASLRYDITSYGADYDVEGLVRRLERGDILVPDFQRSYVWTLTEASRFVESLLLGLPVPGIFLAREVERNRFLVIDGQQRLKTLMFFYHGTFNPKPGDKSTRVFALSKVQERFEGKTYETLSETERLRLDNSILHATVVRQETPPADDTSMYHIFERLNNGGRKLAAQEIRCAMYHGPFIDLIKWLNESELWRKIFGKVSPHLKDQELVLRFLALYHESATYRRPMAEFLNLFAGKHQMPDHDFLDDCAHLFISTIEVVWSTLGRKSFRLGRALNAAVFDSVMVGLSRRLQDDAPVAADMFLTAYEELLLDPDYLAAVSRSTADESFVSLRLEKATERFARI